MELADGFVVVRPIFAVRVDVASLADDCLAGENDFSAIAAQIRVDALVADDYLVVQNLFVARNAVQVDVAAAAADDDLAVQNLFVARDDAEAVRDGVAEQVDVANDA